MMLSASPKWKLQFLRTAFDLKMQTITTIMVVKTYHDINATQALRLCLIALVKPAFCCMQKNTNNSASEHIKYLESSSYAIEVKRIYHTVRVNMFDFVLVNFSVRECVSECVCSIVHFFMCMCGACGPPWDWVQSTLDRRQVVPRTNTLQRSACGVSVVNTAGDVVLV